MADLSAATEGNAMTHPGAVTDGTFKSEVLDAETPVLVDFWAEWCPPCKMLAPYLDKIANDQEGRLKIAKVDVDANRGVASQYEVLNIPTMILFKGGQPVERMVGFMPERRILEKVEPHIG